MQKFLTLLFLIVSGVSSKINAQTTPLSLGDAQGEAEAYINALKTDGKLRNAFDEKRNVVIDRDGVIHVFINEDGNMVLRGFPTTATEKDKFQVHLFKSATNTAVYRLEVDGAYQPALNIDRVSGTQGFTTQKNGNNITQIDFGVYGPYTNSVSFTIKVAPAGDSKFETLTSSTVKIAKTVHASIGTGFFYSTLRNPSNIRQVAVDGNSSTLIADNPNGNFSLALMATLHPFGKSSLLLSRPAASWQRLGISVGTTVASDEKNFKNLFLGLQYDFAVGGAIVAGVDVAERQMVRGVNYEDFEFGETAFTGTLEQFKKVGAGFFFGVQVDTRIFRAMFGAE